MSFLTANTEAILRQYLDDSYVKQLLQNRPFFDRIKKTGDIGGLSTKVPVFYGYGGGVSGTFSDALANAQSGGAKRDAFTISPAKAYGITTLVNDEVQFTQTPESAVDIMTDATAGAMELAAQNFEAMMFSDGYGTLATISTATNTTGNIWKLVLALPTDANKFNMGMVLTSKATPAAASLDTGTATVLGNNPIEGSILVDVASSGMTPTATHVIGLDGQQLPSTSPSTFPGIFGWNPPITSRTLGVPGDTFLGVARSTSSPIIANSGWAIDGRGKPILPTLNNLCAQMANLKMSKPNLGICNPVTLAKVCNELDTKARYDMKSITEADVFFEGVEIMTPAGKVELFAESACPANQVVVTRGDVWNYAYPKKPFAPTNLDGTIATKAYNTNETRFSISCAGYFFCTNLSACGNILITP